MSDTRENIIELGDHLLREKGYNAFSYADISKQLAIRNAAIHYYFPSKADLVAAIIDRHLQHFADFKVTISGKKPMDKITMFLDTYTKTQEQGMICIVGTMASNWNSCDETLQEKVREFADGVLTWLKEILQDGLDKGIFAFKELPGTRALLMVTNMLAVVQLMRISGPQVFQVVKKAILDGLKG